MLDALFADKDFKNKNILILGSPRSGTHALASVISQRDQSLLYLSEVGMHQTNPAPWQDFDLFKTADTRKLAHVVQTYAKIFSISKCRAIKKSTIVVGLRRRDKVKQFASWRYFKHIGAIYNFQHDGQDYLPPGSLTATRQDIEEFIIDQIIDDAFCPDYVYYYEDLGLEQSKIKKNQYVYPIEQIFSNLEFVQDWLSDWKYND